MSHLIEMSNITTRANNQFPRPDFHRLDKQPHRLQPFKGGIRHPLWVEQLAISQQGGDVGSVRNRIEARRNRRHPPASGKPAQRLHPPSKGNMVDESIRLI